MIKKKILACSLTLAMLPSFSVLAEESVYIDIVADSDIFLKTSTNVSGTYVDGLYYYDGAKFSEEIIEFSDMDYRLYTDISAMDSKVNDVAKVGGTGLELAMNNSPAKTVGIMLFTRDTVSDSSITVSVNYENGASESYPVTIHGITDSENSVSAGAPLEVVKQSAIMYKAVEAADVNAYLHSCVIDISQSVNKSVPLESVTLPAADFTYYVAAATQVNYSEDELGDFTQQIIKELYSKYADISFIQLAENENGVNLTEAEELKQSLISQLGKAEEATEENIEKISMLIEGCKLYQTVIDCQNGITLGDKYLDISADFDEPEDTELTDADYTELGEILAVYERYESMDKDRLGELADIYGIEADFELDLSGRDKIQALYDAYGKAMQKSELKAEIEKYYNTYISKDISEITSADEPALFAMLEAFDKAKQAGIELSEYDDGYIRHLYNDYGKYLTSEDGYAVDISSSYDADSIANAGDRADSSTWYESNDNISGSKFLNASHGNISSYNAATGALMVKEYEYTENNSTASPYKFTATGYDIPFVIPSNGLNGGVCDSVLLEANSEEAYTVNMNSVYANRIYVLLSGEESEFSVNVLYNDGTEELVKFNINTTAQLVDKVKTMVYEKLVGYITSGDYGNYNLGNDGVIYRNDGNVTNGIGVFAIEPDSQKGVTSLTFCSTTKNTAIYGVSVMPEANSAVSEYAEDLYNEIVTETGVDTSDKAKVARLVMAYNECVRRGLYISGIDTDVLAELNGMVLTASGSVYRADKTTTRAEVIFSVPVDTESAKQALTVTADGKPVTAYEVSFNEDSTQMTVNIPISKEGIGSLTVAVAATVKTDAYKNITMMYPLSLDTEITAYITAGYIGSNMKITNNSAAAQAYVAYVQAADEEKIYSVNMTEGTLEGRSEVSLSMPIWDYPDDAVVSAAVLDALTFEPLCEITVVGSCKAETVKGSSYDEPSFDLATGILTVNGFTPSLGEDKAVSVRAKASDTVIYCGMMRTNADGYFCFDIPVDTEAVPAGTLEIKIGGDDFASYVQNNSISISSNNEKMTFVNSLKNASAANEVYALLNQAEQALSISFNPMSHIMADEDMQKNLAERIFALKTEIEAIGADDSTAEIGRKSALVQKIIKQQAVLECVASGEKELYSDGTALLYDELMAYSSIDSDKVTIYELFTDGMNDTGKKAVINAVDKKRYANCESLYDDLEETIMLNALLYPSTKGTGYVKNVLTKANADAVGITITKYLNLKDKSAASAHIANMSISSLEDVEDYIATLESMPSGGSGSGGGGSSSSGTGSGYISQYPVADAFVPTQDTAEAVPQKSEFSDLPRSHWGYNQVMTLCESGIVNGYGDGTFGTDRTITRAEFVKLVCLVKGINVGGYENIFTDVSADDWYAPYVCAAYNAGLVNGISDTEFGADLPVSRQDICVILYRSDNTVSDIQPEFNDSADISDYAAEAVGYFSSKGVVNGFDGNVFRPLENASRVQAAAIIYNYTTIN